MYINSMKIHLKMCRTHYIYSVLSIYICMCVCVYVLYECTRAHISVGR